MIGLDLSPGQRSRPAPRGLESFFAASGGQNVALAAGRQGALNVWTEIGPNHAACLRFDGADTGTRLSWRETLVMELRDIYPVGDLSLSGSWSLLQSSGSGLSDSYTGNRAASTSSAAARADVTVGKASEYDVWVYFTGRTSGAYARVDIDGDQALVNEISDPADLGFKAFSTYTPVNMQRRQSIKVASGLTGDHTVTVRFGGAASPGGTTFMLEAVAISADLGGARILPPMWQAGQSYEMGDEVQYQGTFYAARANGTSGTTPPSHLNGIASDGALDWRADNRSTYPGFVCIDFASEREYALRCSVGGSSVEIGGQTHGNEDLIGRTLMLDGASFTPLLTGTGLRVGSAITLTEQTIWKAAGSVDLAICSLTREISPGQINHEVTATSIGPVADIEWLYLGMAPFVRWDGESRSTVMDRIAVGDAAPVVLASFEGQSPSNLDYPGGYQMGITGEISGAALRYGVAVTLPSAPGNVVSQIDTFLRPNLDASTASGGLDWKAKAYVAGGADGGLSLGAGETIAFASSHVFGIG